jgi:hypothetical protein
MRRLIVVGIGVITLLWNVVPAGALSPGECADLKRQIARSRQMTKTGGLTLTREIESLRHAEENARNELVRSGCNKKINAGKPECQAIVARVHAAAAERRAAEGSWRRSMQAAAAVDVAALTARYDAECTGTMRSASQPERKPITRKPKYEAPTADDAKTAAAVILGIGILGTALSTRGPRGPSGPGHMPNHRRR